MDRLLELWQRWMQDQTTATIEELLKLGRAEIGRRREAKAFQEGTERAIQEKLDKR